MDNRRSLVVLCKLLAKRSLINRKEAQKHTAVIVEISILVLYLSFVALTYLPFFPQALWKWDFFLLSACTNAQVYKYFYRLLCTCTKLFLFSVSLFHMSGEQLQYPIYIHVYFFYIAIEYSVVNIK